MIFLSEAIFNFHDTVLLATAFQSFLFVLLLLIAKRDPHLSDYFIIGFFIAQVFIPVHLLISYGEVFRLIAIDRSPNLFLALEIAYWLEGPLLLWYTRSLLNKEFKLTRFDFIYLLPALLSVIYNSVTFFSWETAEKISYISEYHELIAPSLPHSIEAVRETIFIVFGVLCLREIKHAQDEIHHRYSNIEKIEFAWLATLVVAFMMLRGWTLLVVATAFIAPDLGTNTFNAMGLAGNYLMFAIVSALIFFSLTRSSILAGKISKRKLGDQPDDHRPDPVLTQKLTQHMQDKKPYLSHYLNLEELAKQLAMHPRALSVAIKHNFNTNFYEFINTYRIDEAKLMLEDESKSHLTMIDISGESGFNSKATFNSFFKKLVGMTPTQYKSKVNSL